MTVGILARLYGLSWLVTAPFCALWRLSFNESRPDITTVVLINSLSALIPFGISVVVYIAAAKNNRKNPVVWATSSIAIVTLVFLAVLIAEGF